MASQVVMNNVICASLAMWHSYKPGLWIKQDILDGFLLVCFCFCRKDHGYGPDSNWCWVLTVSPLPEPSLSGFSM